MSTATFATPTARRNQNLNRQTATLKLGPVSARFVVITLVSLLALLYLNQVTKTSYFTYQRAALTTTVDKLTAQRQDLQVEASRLQAIHSVQSSSAAKGMVAEGTPTYAN